VLSVATGINRNRKGVGSAGNKGGLPHVAQDTAILATRKNARAVKTLCGGEEEGGRGVLVRARARARISPHCCVVLASTR
jgi:hypothetical protein